MEPSVEKLLLIMETLRKPDGCAWDREQNLQSLKQYLIEESYEVIDAINSGDPRKHAEELGDLLLQVVFQAQIRAEAGDFDFAEVVKQICAKLIRRHPHVFAGLKAESTGAILKTWENIKAEEKAAAGSKPEQVHSVIGEVPRHLPALHRAHHIQKKVARIGFDWQKTTEVVAKIEEELEEIKQALTADNPEKVHEEIGDLLFAVVNLSRFQGINSEEALNLAVSKFTRRFQAVEARLQTAGRKLTECGLDELEAQWTAVKQAEVNLG